MSASSGLRPLPSSENHNPLSSSPSGGVPPDRRPGQHTTQTTGTRLAEMALNIGNSSRSGGPSTAQQTRTAARSPTARQRRTQTRGTARSPETRHRRTQTRITPISAAARTYGAARTAAAPSPANTATATQATEPARCEGCGSRPFSRLIFGIVDDVAAVCQVRWGLASCSDCDTTALVLELPRPGRERLGARTLAGDASMGREGQGRSGSSIT